MAARRPDSTPSAADLRPGPGRAETLRIERVGADGDGLARRADGSAAYVPFALPGEVVRGIPELVRGGNVFRVRDAALVETSADRVVPPCRHFGACGGCVLQHWSDGAQTEWKAGLVTHALERAGFPLDAPPPVAVTPPGSRRRMDLALCRVGGTVTIGFHARGAATVVAVAECHVLAPALVGLIAPLRDMLRGLSALKRTGSVVANVLASGVDLLLRLDSTPDTADRARLIAFATAQGLVRLSIAADASSPEPVCVFRPPVARFGGVAVPVPPGAFLQASSEGEAAIVGAVLAAVPAKLPRRAWIADLYAGCGTLTFPLAARTRVAAFEGDAASVGALRSGANAAALGGRVQATARDLARRPLVAAELTDCAVAVLDPPHAGAEAQTRQLAAAGVPRVIYVSCNPQALGRDAAALRATGYRLLAANVIDQFRWSARVESVSVFAK